MKAWEQYEKYQQVVSRGHEYIPVKKPYTAKPGSHDDGPDTGLFLGGIGAPVCSRSQDGHFSRWHLQTGYHVQQVIDSAFLGLRWQNDQYRGYFRLNKEEAEKTHTNRRVYSLFPVIHEYYFGGMMPCEVIVEFFTPILPEDNLRSTLPVWYATVVVKNTGDIKTKIDTVLFFPNLLGWKVQQMTSVDRPVRSWPGQTHAGNTATVFNPDYHLSSPQYNELKEKLGNYKKYFSSLRPISGVMQQRNPERPVLSDLEGQTAILPFQNSSETLRSGVETCFKAGQNILDSRPQDQKFTIAWVEDYFARNGALPESGLSWEAHWDEAIGSAVSQGKDLKPGESSAFDFCITMDMPIVTFGGGRKWYRKYTEYFGSSGKNAITIAAFGALIKEQSRKKLDNWHREVLSGNQKLSMKLKGAMLNELYFMNGGGAFWSSRCMNQGNEGIETPLLGKDEHAGLLEGFDVGYYYYNTSDLWPYTWYGVSRWWPEFSNSIFSDYIKTIPVEIKTEHIIYRTETMAQNLVKGKIPHDLGAVMEDPWHKINGYQMRDNSNLWKDHNPGFIISLYLHHLITGRELNHEKWAAVKQAGLFMLAQIDTETGLPKHDSFGDSTWDNLGIEGTAGFSSSLTLAALAALIVWAKKHEDGDFAGTCRDFLKRGQDSYISALWNGSYYRLSDTGKYAECTMADGILGFYLADLAGLLGFLPRIDRQNLKSHLLSVFKYNFLQYENGRVGPLLVASENRVQFSGDGGDELQVNEVLIGSAWLTVAMMYHFSLEKEASIMAESIRRTIYDDSGMQFKTPAAYDAYGKFRAPMNLRPLSIWFLDEENLSKTRKNAPTL